MVTFIQTTAQYTNAALVAILPYITDFAKKLDLSLKTPITTNQVKRFLCDPRKGHVEGSIFLFNGDHFAFVDGVVVTGHFKTSQSGSNQNQPP